jgi:hypothetical protein
MSVFVCAKFLKAVDFTLDSGAFPVEPKPLHRPHTLTDYRRRRGWLGSNLRDQLGVHRT